MIKKLTKLVLLLCFGLSIQAQEELVIQTFRNTRVINSHSIETLPANKMDFRIAHRFGDIAGDAGGWPSFFGLENASDVLIGFEYGMTDNFTVGINRAKGAGPLKQNVNVLTKFKIIKQEVNGNNPFSLAVVGNASISTMPKGPEGTLAEFSKFEHRLGYHLGLHVARKFSERFSLQLHGAWTYRNLVGNNDVNDLVSIGGAFRFQMTKAMGLIVDANLPFSSIRTTENGYYPAIGIGIEFDTGGGHTFQMNFTNATGLVENDFIPNTRTNWLDGEYRLGFTISRLFSL